KAYTLDKKAALKSASWGKFQILASNYATAGYASPEDFVFALSKSEKNQLKAFVSFIKADRVLLRSIRTKDWLSFAQRYNGPRQKGYDLKMERNYNASL
ncbi:TPA: N-acetylmuramidase domain-containing protein, partial [Escherichia coli]